MARGEHLEEKQVGVATRFTSERQPTNRRTPDKISSLLKQELQSDGWTVFEDAEMLDEDKEPTGKKVCVRVKLTTAEAVAKRLLANAAAGRERSIEIVLERTEGKVPQDLNLGGNIGPIQFNTKTLTPEEAAIMRKLVGDENRPDSQDDNE